MNRGLDGKAFGPSPGITTAVRGSRSSPAEGVDGVEEDADAADLVLAGGDVDALGVHPGEPRLQGEAGELFGLAAAVGLPGGELGELAEVAHAAGDRAGARVLADHASGPSLGQVADPLLGDLGEAQVAGGVLRGAGESAQVPDVAAVLAFPDAAGE